MSENSIPLPSAPDDGPAVHKLNGGGLNIKIRTVDGDHLLDCSPQTTIRDVKELLQVSSSTTSTDESKTIGPPIASSEK